MQEGSHQENTAPMNLKRFLDYRREKGIGKENGWRRKYLCTYKTIYGCNVMWLGLIYISVRSYKKDRNSIYITIYMISNNRKYRKRTFRDVKKLG